MGRRNGSAAELSSEAEPMRYHAELMRAWDRWVITIPDAWGVHAPVDRLEDAEAIARAAIALLTDSDPASFEIAIRLAD